VARLIDDAHAAVSDASIELIATVKDWLTGDRLGRGVTVVWTVIDVVRETAPTNWAFFHLLARSAGSPPSQDIGRPARRGVNLFLSAMARESSPSSGKSQLTRCASGDIEVETCRKNHLEKLTSTAHEGF
jgi:hypothetical protein